MNEKLKIKKDEILVIGDGLNDLEMISEFPNSVAMGNGVEELKKAASYTTDHIVNDGFAKALKHFKII